MAIDGKRSNFTSENNYTLDTFKEMFELSASEVAKVQRWKVLKAKNNRTSEEDAELKDLATQLTSKLITSDDWNLLLHAMYNLERAYVDKGLDKIDESVEGYLEDYAKGHISEELDKTINELLLTNATKITISTSQPTVENGALWIKPKTTI